VLSLVFVLQVVAACVTINVYFPAVAAEKAADRIIQDVWGQQPGAESPPAKKTPDGQTPEASPEPQSRRIPEWQQQAMALGGQLMSALIPVAHAAEPNIDISSPAIRKITNAMEKRHSQLKPYYDAGAIGLTRDALIEVRDLNAVPLPKRGEVRRLVAAENRDRNALYAEIARANGHPEWEADIRQVFARQWIQKAPSGWYYRKSDGGWTKK
jgi:uncharacterized protein YdbL (DUF1318 family)